MIEIRVLKNLELEEFVRSKEYYSLASIPITRQRVVSHIRNPRRDPDDSLLLLAYQDDLMVGYLGLLPDFLYQDDETPLKFVWPTCLWVDTAVRGAGIAQLLMEKALELCQNNMLVTEFAPLSKKIYVRTKSFDQSVSLEGIRLYMKMDLHSILPSRKKVFKYFAGLLRGLDWASNFLLEVKDVFSTTDVDPNSIEYINFIDSEANDFIIQHQQKELFKRRQSELNWVLKYPWIISAPIKDSFSKKYHFSSIANSFEYYCLKIRDRSHKLVALLILSRRDNTLKMPYCYFEQNQLAEVITVINFHIEKLKVSTFTTFNPDVARYYQEYNSPGFYKRKICREYLVSNSIHEKINHTGFNVQDGDGDCVFT